MKKLSLYSRIATGVSALMLVSVYYLPLWQIQMWAPQYPEGLNMKIWVDNLTGDVRIISALNHYIGMRPIAVNMFPEFGYMIYIVGGVIGVGLLAVLINRKIMVQVYCSMILCCGLAALTDFYMWGYNYGHTLDPAAPIIVPGMSYQPPLIGTKQLLNFTAFSGPETGGWIFVVSGLLAFAAFGFEWYKNRTRTTVGRVVWPLSAVLASAGWTSCDVTPQPLRYGYDACHHCKMILMDNRFGGELISGKGKIFRFDDVNCMVRFIHSGHLHERDITQYLITDFASPGILIDAKTAWYSKSEQIKSPMAGNTAAFREQVMREKYNNTWKGKELRWDDLLVQYK